MAAMPRQAPQRTLLSRLRDWLGGGQREHREVREEARRQRERADQAARAWERTEQELREQLRFPLNSVRMERDDRK
ncbi:MAG: hypothetical protein QM692_15115 [Thermomicrobiales bacterium]